MRYGSLFAGIGGFDLGFDRAGWTCAWQVEIDPYCRRVLAKHWPDVRRYGDVKECGKHNLESVDVICGGDPCQENSNARQGTGLESPSLGGEFIRVVDELRTRLVVRENPSRVRSDAPWPWHRFRAALEQLDYIVVPFRLRACCFGLDHQRERLFLLGQRADTVQTRLQRHEFEEMARASWQSSLCHITGQDRRRPAPRISRGTDGIPNRAHRIRGLGNAVVPQVAQWIAERINAAEQS